MLNNVLHSEREFLSEEECAHTIKNVFEKELSVREPVMDAGPFIPIQIFIHHLPTAITVTVMLSHL